MKTLTPITAEAFEKIASYLGPCELVDGEIITMVPGGIPHSTVSANVTGVLVAYSRKKKNGRILANEAGVVVKRNRDTVRGADALYISYKRLPTGVKWKGFLRQPPELVAEVLGDDDTWKNIEKKVDEYHAFGVDLVWVADPRTLSVRVYPRKGEPSVLHETDYISGGKLLPGFRCKVAEFFLD